MVRQIGWMGLSFWSLGPEPGYIAMWHEEGV